MFPLAGHDPEHEGDDGEHLDFDPDGVIAAAGLGRSVLPGDGDAVWEESVARRRGVDEYGGGDSPWAKRSSR